MGEVVAFDLYGTLTGGRARRSRCCGGASNWSTPSGSPPSRDGEDREGVLAPLRGLVGLVWTDKQTALIDIDHAMLNDRHPSPMDRAFRLAVVNAISTPTSEGAIQYSQGAALPDPTSVTWCAFRSTQTSTST
jgi:hypothetical protein